MPVQPVNQIFYGPPATGKTLKLQQLQQQFTEQLAKQDYHTLLTEKIRDLSWSEVICLVFLEEQRLLRVPEIIQHPFMRCKIQLTHRNDNISQTVWGTLMRHSALDSVTVKYNLSKRSSLALFDKDAAGLWFLLPSAYDDVGHLKAILNVLEQGVQTTETVQRYSMVTFHQSYSYEDFMEGLRPVLDDVDAGSLRYEIKCGVFLALCERARQDPEHQYAMFIDEINRGNIAKIFGELISLIELDKRTGSDGALEVVLPYSGQKFSVPHNVSIYGSMNTADRFLTLIDTALRRRFEFIEMSPDYAVLASQLARLHDELDVDIVQLVKILNARIELLVGRDYLLGHGYFCHIKTFADLQQVMQQKIVPLLQEYCFDDWQKIRLILNDHRKPEDLQFIQQHDAAQQAILLLGAAFAEHATHLTPHLQTVYRLNESAFANIQAYQLIYAN